MQAIYEINVMPDKLKSLEGRVFALRLFLDVLLYEIVGNDVSSKYISDMITSRYETLNQKMGENEEPIWKKYVVFWCIYQSLWHGIWEEIQSDILYLVLTQ